jgi:hypothetical protein
MSAARDLFGSIPFISTSRSQNDYDTLCSAAELWRNEG